MKILHLNHSDIVGGAARAAYRIHQSLNSVGEISRMWVNHAHSGDWTVSSLPSRADRIKIQIKEGTSNQIKKLGSSSSYVLHSSAIFNSRWLSLINNSDFDIVNLHWVGSEMLSIRDISRIEKPLVWTMHDMWPFCGAEHYTEDSRWISGYFKSNRPKCESGFDINKWVWSRKKSLWRNPIHMISPSKWLAESARASSIMDKWPISHIPYPIDAGSWREFPMQLAREILGLPANCPLLLFGAMGGSHDRRKGFDLLQQALNLLKYDQAIKNMRIVIFGELTPEIAPALGFDVTYMGSLQDNATLQLLYSACDAMVVPSRQDNLPLTAMESQACGLPVIAFEVGGLRDIISHQVNGYLAPAFQVESLANGIRWALGLKNCSKIRSAARDNVIRKYDPKSIAFQYLEVYQDIIKSWKL